ncbi:MAG: ATP-binding protein [Planctomycetes bacterium]|nr:ATP-binding protein [Planctomycetota bacterium]
MFGPRGVGKSTWLAAALPEAARFDLLDLSTYQRFLARPSSFGAELEALPRGTTVVVDEVQRLPELLNEVHRAIEGRRLRFALCGSSARKLKVAGTNLLAGRAVQRFLHPLVPAELGSAFDLEEVLRWGALPIIFTAPEREETLEAYAQLYLTQEIQAEALVRNLPGFARFLPIAALFHAEVLNAASLARDAEVSRTTVLSYLEVLEDTLLAFRLPAYEARLRVRERKHPKLYWADPGIVRSVRKRRGAPTSEERGKLFEGWIASLLRSYRDYEKLFDAWSYWAPGKGSLVEVDFLLQRGDEILALEVKSSARVEERELAGLRAIGELPEVVRRVVLFGGPRRQRTPDGIELLPLRAFLEELEGGTLFP